MATKESELKRLRREVEVLKKKVARLEKKNGKRRIVTRSKRPLSEREHAREILRRASVTRALTPTEERVAAKWDALSEQEKREAEATLRRVRLDPPLSQLIHELRR